MVEIHESRLSGTARPVATDLLLHRPLNIFVASTVLDYSLPTRRSRSVSARFERFAMKWSAQDYAEWGRGELDQEVERGFSGYTAMAHTGGTYHYWRTSFLSKLLHEWRVTVTSA